MLSSGASSPDLRSTLASIYFQIGDIGSASHHLEVMEKEDGPAQDIITNILVLRSAFLGDWETVVQILQTRKKEATSQDKHVQRAVVRSACSFKSCRIDCPQDANNMSVALLNVGKLSEAISVLEEAFRNMPSIAVVAEPLIFNLGERASYC